MAAAEGGDRPRCELCRAPESPRSSARLARWRQSCGASLVSQSSGVQVYVGERLSLRFWARAGRGAARAGRPARRSSRGPSRDPRGPAARGAGGWGRPSRPGRGSVRAHPGRLRRRPNSFPSPRGEPGTVLPPSPGCRGAVPGPGRGPSAAILSGESPCGVGERSLSARAAREVAPGRPSVPRVSRS